MLGETLIVRDGRQALNIRAAYMQRGGDVGAIWPEGFDNETIIGDPIPLQVKRMVEATPGFWEWEGGKLGDGEFVSRLDEQLPLEFLGPRLPVCGLEIEEAMRAEEAPILQAIEDKYRRRYPGFKL